MGEAKPSDTGTSCLDLRKKTTANRGSGFWIACLSGTSIVEIREKEGDDHFEYEVGQPSEDDCNQGEEAPPIELLPPPVYDDEGNLLQPPPHERQ